MQFLLLIVIIVVVIVLANIAWSTVRLGISPTPSNTAMRQTCSAMLTEIIDQHSAQSSDQLPHTPEPPSIIIAGSGWGGLAFFLSRHHKGPFICYEAAFIPWFCSRAAYQMAKRINKTQRKIRFVRENTKQLQAPVNSIVVCYLFPGGTQTLYKTLKQASSQPLGLLSIAFAVNHVNATQQQKASDWMNTPIYWYCLHGPSNNENQTDNTMKQSPH